MKDSFFVDQLDKVILDEGFATRLCYHRVLLVKTGSGKLSVDNNDYLISGSEIFLMGKGQVYRFYKSEITGFVLSFGDCFWEKAPASASNCKAILFDNVASNQRLVLAPSEFTELSFLLSTLHDEFIRSPYTNQIDALAAYLKIFMIKLANIKVVDEGTYERQDQILYRNFLELLSKKFKSHREVSDYALMLDITARRLTDICKRCSDSNAKELINGHLVAEAKRSLQFSSSPVKEIAYQLNFSSPEQFSHFFKKATSYSPAHYRDQFINLGVRS